MLYWLFSLLSRHLPLGAPQKEKNPQPHRQRLRISHIFLLSTLRGSDLEHFEAVHEAELNAVGIVVLQPALLAIIKLATRVG